MNEKVLVTGAAGFIGSSLCDALLESGYQVIGVDTFTDYYDRALKQANLKGACAHAGFMLLEEDLLSMDLAPLLREVSGIYHLAGQPGVRGSWGRQFDLYVRNNIMITQRLLEAALEVGGKPIVYASSSSVYGNLDTMPLNEAMAVSPVSPYGVTKLAAEQLCRLYSTVHGLPTMSLRLFTVYGPRQRPDMAIHRFLCAARAGQEITIYGDGTQTRDFTYVGDVVNAFRLAMRFCQANGARLKPEDLVLNVAGGTRASINDVLALVERVTGCHPLVGCMPVQPGDVRDTWADTSRARATLGFAAQVRLEEGLASHWLEIAGAG